jgi:hypothetical protein
MTQTFSAMIPVIQNRRSKWSKTPKQPFKHGTDYYILPDILWSSEVRLLLVDQEDGYAYTLSPNELNITIVEVQDIEGQTQIIPQLPTDKSQKLLGVRKNPIGNQQDEVR